MVIAATGGAQPATVTLACDYNSKLVPAVSEAKQ